MWCWLKKQQRHEQIERLVNACATAPAGKTPGKVPSKARAGHTGTGDAEALTSLCDGDRICPKAPCMLVKQPYQNAESKNLSSQHQNHKPCPNVQSPSTASKPADTKAATCDDSCAKKDRRSAEPANKPACCTLTSSSAGQSNTMWCSSSTSPDRHRWQIRCSRATLGLSQRPVSTRSWCDPVRS